MARSENEALQGSPRERLLAAAGELFYAEGVHSVGIDRVIERAGVAKASLYSSFGSKEELVCAYLEARFQARRRRIEAGVAREKSARARLLAVFDVLGEITSEAGYRGCAFVNASAEGPRADRVAEVVGASRAWVLELFVGLARELGVVKSQVLGKQLALLYDGVSVRASLDRDAHAAADARAMAEVLIDASSKRSASDAGKRKALRS